MEIWLDTADFDLIESAKEMGILHGVTTNPSIAAKSNMQLEDLLEKLLQIQSGPVTAQVTAEDAKKMIEQGESLYRFSNRIIVKVPVTREGLKAIHGLSQKKIPVMATAVFDSNQVLLAARAGATYIAPYFSSICELDMSGVDLFKAMFVLLDRYKYTAKLLGASLKSAEQVRQCSEIGTPAVTLNKEVFLSFIENNPETLKRVEKFSKDWQSAKARKTLPL
jgi:transaldolase